MAKLTAKQLKFCDHYIKHRKGTDAARYAGYKGNDKTLAVVANENLNKPYLRDYIEKRIEKIDKKQILSLQEVLEGISSIAMDNENVSSRDRLKAYELLGKTHAAFTEKTINENININDPVTELLNEIKNVKH